MSENRTGLWPSPSYARVKIEPRRNTGLGAAEGAGLYRPNRQDRPSPPRRPGIPASSTGMVESGRPQSRRERHIPAPYAAKTDFAAPKAASNPRWAPAQSASDWASLARPAAVKARIRLRRSSGSVVILTQSVALERLQIMGQCATVHDQGLWPVRPIWGVPLRRIWLRIARWVGIRPDGSSAHVIKLRHPARRLPQRGAIAGRRLLAAADGHIPGFSPIRPLTKRLHVHTLALILAYARDKGRCPKNPRRDLLEPQWRKTMPLVRIDLQKGKDASLPAEGRPDCL